MLFGGLEVASDATAGGDVSSVKCRKSGCPSGHNGPPLETGAFECAVIDLGQIVGRQLNINDILGGQTGNSGRANVGQIGSGRRRLHDGALEYREIFGPALSRLFDLDPQAVDVS
ncbi:hypothetical protein J2W92_004092 [Rhizobium leguminosarum]